MAEKDLKKKLLQTLVASQDRESELDKLGDDLRPDPERWTAKDHLAHLAHWRRYAAQVLTAVRTGTTAPHVDDEDALNAEVQAANRDRPAEAVKEDARASYAELARAVDDCSDEDLLKTTTWTGIGRRVGGGPRQRAPAFRRATWVFWYEAQGDDKAAEQAHLWTLEVHEAAFTEPKRRAFGAYNLGWLLRQAGRAQEAVPYLKRSFELQPDLKEWARTGQRPRQG